MTVVWIQSGQSGLYGLEYKQSGQSELYGLDTNNQDNQDYMVWIWMMRLMSQPVLDYMTKG